MFLKRNRRTKDGETYEYWSLVETVRTARGPRHRLVANLGKLPGLDRKHRHGWEDLAALLDGRPQPQRGAGDLFGEGSPDAGAGGEAAPGDGPRWMEVDVRGLRVGRVRDFGQVYLALALWRRLGLHTLLEELLPRGRETVPWPLVACILTIARFCGNRSELEVAGRWYQESALEDLLGVGWEQIYDNRLYRGLDCLVEHKDAICQHLLERYQSWFGVDFEFLLYDVTSTYFEGQAAGNAKAKRGYSRDRRPDCKQINIGLVVTPEGGLPVGYEIFDGNRADVTTVEDMVRLMEDKYGKARRVWVMDRGMVSEENLDFLRGRGASYLVGTPKGQLRHFGQALLEEADWSEVRPGVEVKLVDHPDGRGGEQYIVARSKDRRDKESAMLAQAKARLLAKLREIDASLKKRPARPEAIERRIGRWQGKHSRAERYYQVEIRTGEIEVRPGGGDRPAKKELRAIGLEITEKEVPLTWAERSAGAYLLRTNCTEKDPAKLWTWYIHLTQAEECFRISKSDLGLRPVFHQKTGRVEAHVLVCFLTLAIWRVLEMWMKGKGLGNCCRQLLKEVSTIRMMDVVLPVRDAGELNLRVVSRPDDRVAQLLARLGLELPTAPKIISDVVSKIEGAEG
jgi:transposase